MTEIDRLFAGDSNEVELRAAFTLQHPKYSSTVECPIDREGRTIYIRGCFLGAEGEEIGRFSRQLSKAGGRWRAFHEQIYVKEPFRRQGIASAHYRAAIQYYVYGLKAEYVAMHADDLGPYVWPGFGFEFSEDKESIREELAQLFLAETGKVLDVPDRSFLIASLSRSSSAPDIGLEAIKVVADRLRAPMPMLLNSMIL